MSFYIAIRKIITARPAQWCKTLSSHGTRQILYNEHRIGWDKQINKTTPPKLWARVNQSNSIPHPYDHNFPPHLTTAELQNIPPDFKITPHSCKQNLPPQSSRPRCLGQCTAAAPALHGSNGPGVITKHARARALSRTPRKGGAWLASASIARRTGCIILPAGPASDAAHGWSRPRRGAFVSVCRRTPVAWAILCPGLVGPVVVVVSLARVKLVFRWVTLWAILFVDGIIGHLRVLVYQSDEAFQVLMNVSIRINKALRYFDDIWR